jgi:hypothetical protein
MTLDEARRRWIGTKVRFWTPGIYNEDGQKHYLTGTVHDFSGPTVEHGCTWIMCEDGIGYVVGNHQVEPL